MNKNTSDQMTTKTKRYFVKVDFIPGLSYLIAFYCIGVVAIEYMMIFYIYSILSKSIST